jgi:putative nucleotidyltransferase with HDIG domain
MKTRILFVDDNPLILQGLRRLLHGMREEWELEFAESGMAALALMGERPFDGVVTDLKMPGMNGADFLTEVLKHHPQTVRLVLSGHSEQELTYRCVGVAHQCLSKPCDPETLRRTIQRTIQSNHSPKNEAIRKLVAHLDRLPTIPALYTEMMERLRDPETCVEDVAAIVRKDPALTAKLLQLVNSAFFGLSRPMASILEAVTYLGMETIRCLMLSLSAFSRYERTQSAGVSMTEVWQHSLRTAEIARRIVHEQELPERVADAAFVGGLLHDIGRLVLASNCPMEYLQVSRLAGADKLTLEEAEDQVFSCNHADVGGYLLGLWGLPPPVVDAIGRHHRPAASEDTEFTPLTAVHVANVLDWEQTPGKGGFPPPTLDLPYLAGLGVQDWIPAWSAMLKPTS